MYEYELTLAARRIVEDMLHLKKSETFVITADTESDDKVVDAVAGAAYAVGAKPLVIKIPAPGGVGKAADPSIPVEALSAVLCRADAWVEFNNQWLLYSTPFEIAVEKNKALRYLCLVGMNRNMMVRTIGKVNQVLLSKLLNRLAGMNRQVQRMKVTTPAGTDLAFEMEPSYSVVCDDGNASLPGIHMLGGQISIFPKFETINGTLVFDGALSPPCGLLREPVKMQIEKGRIVEIKGGTQAGEFQSWLKAFDDPNMMCLAHCSYGLNPGAKLTGNILEDERVWGCIEWGIGYVSALDAPPGIDAKSHTDGICLNASVWLDDVQIFDKGGIIQAELKKLADELSCG
ncbi:aminopeptidase [Geosporobacter ferrireducens]|uniref:aminopeptidase n=1 Tax=Geosporobacter ferrireducens TaxID=1424294 RepID=UPI00139D1E04|nr:aminopeptidase [Geosporobacter ferrireducens]MTI58363.1 aminopeptidase [Geosporobacter ferrireducens]